MEKIYNVKNSSLNLMIINKFIIKNSITNHSLFEKNKTAYNKPLALLLFITLIWQNQSID